MALRGNLQDFTLADVFQLIALSRKRGVLRMRRRDASRGAVWFHDGEVFFAESNWRRERLGDRLVAARRITSDALEQAVHLRAEEPQGRRLGTILVEEGHISREVLEAFVREQILDTVFDLMRWEDGEFDFELTFERPEEDIGLSVSIENIAMESGRRLEEWDRIKRKVPSMDIMFKMSSAPGEGPFEISLKPIEWNLLLLLVDGTRSVSEIARAAQMTDFDVAKVVYGLFSAGLLEVVSDEEAARLLLERTSASAAWITPSPVLPSEFGVRPPTPTPQAPWFESQPEQVAPGPAALEEGHGISELEVRYERIREVTDVAPVFGSVGLVPEAEERQYPQWPAPQPPLGEPVQPSQSVPYVQPAEYPPPPIAASANAPQAEAPLSSDLDVHVSGIRPPAELGLPADDLEATEEPVWPTSMVSQPEEALVDTDVATLGPGGPETESRPLAGEEEAQPSEYPGPHELRTNAWVDARMDFAESSALSEEITELTGAGSAPGPMPRSAAPASDEAGTPHPHAPVDTQTLLSIIEGIKRL